MSTNKRCKFVCCDWYPAHQPIMGLIDLPIYSPLSQLGIIWLFNIAMENGPFIDDFPIKTSIYEGFSMAMLNNQRLYKYKVPIQLVIKFPPPEGDIIGSLVDFACNCEYLWQDMRGWWPYIKIWCISKTPISWWQFSRKYNGILTALPHVQTYPNTSKYCAKPINMHLSLEKAQFVKWVLRSLGWSWLRTTVNVPKSQHRKWSGGVVLVISSQGGSRLWHAACLWRQHWHSEMTRCQCRCTREDTSGADHVFRRVSIYLYQNCTDIDITCFSSWIYHQTDGSMDQSPSELYQK